MSEYYDHTDVPRTTPLTNYVIVTTEVPVVTVNNSDVVGVVGVVVKSIPVINQPIQAFLLIFILVSAILTNSAIILNISRDSLKLRMVHFLLIRHVCITDSVGALFVLPVPLVSFIKGYWDWGDTACSIISTTTACCWTMHLVAVALYRADRVLAVWLPTGRYPLVSARIVNGLLVLVWATALTGSYLATLAFTPAFQPALALCIPNVPLIFFILVFACYIIGLITLTTGYVFAFIRRRRKRKKRKRLGTPSTNLTTPSSKSAPELPTSNTDFCNNRVVITTTLQQNPPIVNPTNKSPRSVNFEEACDSSGAPTPSTSNNSCNVRPLTPPYVPKPRPHTHRRVHSDGVQINAVIASSRESVVSVAYRSLSKRSHDSSQESYEPHHEHATAEESVAEKLDEFDGVSGVVSSSNTTSGAEREGGEIEKECEGEDGEYASEGSRRRARAARCRVFASYGVSIGHLLLYLPSMVTIALIGPSLPPGVAFVCGMVVYCEFIVQPIALLLVSPKLRMEVVQMVRNMIRPQATCNSTSIPNFNSPVPPITHQHHHQHNEITSTAAAVVVNMETGVGDCRNDVRQVCEKVAS